MLSNEQMKDKLTDKLLNMPSIKTTFRSFEGKDGRKWVECKTTISQIFAESYARKVIDNVKTVSPDKKDGKPNIFG